MISTILKVKILLSILLLFVMQGAVASEYSRVYSASSGLVIDGYGAVPVYKFIDSKGRVTYSTSAPTDFIRAQEVAITAPPSPQQQESTSRRFEEMKTAADEFDVARAEREAIREQNEIKRLQRLALINQAKLPVITREYIYPSYPYRLRKKRGGYHSYLPSRRSHRAGLSLPPSSFPATHH